MESKIAERVVALERDVAHNKEAIGSMQKTCENTQREIKEELEKIEDTVKDAVNNGIKEVVTQAVKDAIPDDITVTARIGLSLNDKVLIALITTVGGIVVSLISNGVLERLFT
ncbi:MAG: hypothetical protein ACXABY_28585 [Candidatus Thorarchaeota archaeon]|jgi:preprotein translocase subunit SecF